MLKNWMLKSTNGAEMLDMNNMINIHEYVYIIFIMVSSTIAN